MREMRGRGEIYKDSFDNDLCEKRKTIKKNITILALVKLEVEERRSHCLSFNDNNPHSTNLAMRSPCAPAKSDQTWRRQESQHRSIR